VVLVSELVQGWQLVVELAELGLVSLVAMALERQLLAVRILVVLADQVVLERMQLVELELQ
jgi:hypothetical protein